MLQKQKSKLPREVGNDMQNMTPARQRPERHALDRQKHGLYIDCLMTCKHRM